MFDRLSEKFVDALKSIQGLRKITERNIEEALGHIRRALLEADVNIKVVKSLLETVKKKSLGTKVLRGAKPGEQFVKILHDELAHIMGGQHKSIDFDKQPLTVVLIVGPNGQGKTTFTAKLARFLQEKKKKNPLLIPADTYRPKAKEQLTILAQSIQAKIFNSDLKKSPKAIALEGLSFAKSQGHDVAIIDTAGRLHVDNELMEQVTEIKKAVSSFNPEVLLVVDAMLGQEASQMAKTFHQAVKLTGVVLSKMDSDARGGAALSIAHVTGIPIVYLSTGEKVEDLEPFHPDRLAGRILDMGDVVSLVEKAEEAMSEKEAASMLNRMEKGKFSVDDLVKQMDMLSKIGGMGPLLKMIPGASRALRQLGDLSGIEQEMKKIKIVISSMTKEERQNYNIIKESRIKRIARGSGVTESIVQSFLSKFRKMEKMLGPMAKKMQAFSGQTFAGPQASLFPNSGKMKKKNKQGPWGKGFFSR